MNYARLFPNGQDVQLHRGWMHYYTGLYKMNSGLYYGMYPGGIFGPSEHGELNAAIKSFDAVLQVYEHWKSRLMKVMCYQWMDDRKNALRELEYILDHYADNEEVYLKARKLKDELETSASGVGKFLRSIFG